MEQQQRMLADRPAQEPTISGSGQPADPGRGVEPIAHPDVGKRSDTTGPAPNAPIPFHRALFRTPLEEGGRARRDRGSSSDEAPERDARKGKAPRDGDSPERINDQFSRGIMEDPLPRHYTPLAIGEYNGSADPDGHLAKFDNAATLHQYTDGVKCRVFLTTLSGPAQRWFTRLPTGSIRSFKDFRAAFLYQFASSRQYQKTSVNLFSLKQGPREALRAYIQRFNQTTMDIPAVSSEVLIDRAELLPMATPLYGFTGNEVSPIGQTRCALGVQRDIGPTALNEFRAIVSTYCPKIKFPVGNLVGEVRGDQVAARRCYVEMVKADAKAARKCPRLEVNAIREKPPPLVYDNKEEVQIHLSRPEATTFVASDLAGPQKEELVACLQRNHDVFAWSTHELLGVDPSVALHELHVRPDARPVKQRKRDFSAEQDLIIRAEVEKLLEAGHIEEIQDLNKACPKDSYPLPRIDQMVDSTAGCELICMLDAYQGYHQVPLAHEDQEKVSFVTADGTFCYKVMPFGLKNAGTTYQRMMNKVFRKQIGRNLEVYVDDILIKSLRFVALCADVEETCQKLRNYGIKLNPTKCLFGAKGGRFLGCIVTERGIEANPSKVKALQDMASPRNLKEVQRLTGRITALSRFISKSADRSLTFFKILRRATKFQWDDECDKAFEELKQYLSPLPILAKPTMGEPLLFYLSSTEHAIDSALITEKGGKQQPVYFLSHILKDAESHYTGLEKLSYALILAARRLRPYFLAHSIIVMTNSALDRVLLNPEASGRLIKWTTELSEFDIQYRPRSAIRAQALADFITEVPDPEPESSWRVYVDGSSARSSSGIGILLISPKEDRMHLSIRLDYRATNNEAEYEALIDGLQAARHVGATKVLLHLDLQLAAQQLNGTFEINSARLRLYADAFEKLKANFQEVVIYKIPRSENQAVDELAKLASAMTPIIATSPIERVYLVAHVDQSRGIPFLEDWRAPIIRFLQSRGLPGGHEADRILRRRASRFTLVGEQLYKKAFSRPLLKCVGTEDAEYILQEVHQGSCGGHPGGRSLAKKVILAGYFWPTLQKDASKLWEMDIVGPFPMAIGQRRFLLVVVDYFSKWVEAEPLARITKSMVKKFLWQNIICWFGIPCRLVSDNGRQFTGQELGEWCAGYGIQQAFTSVAYPQSNGQAEVTNREILKALHARLDHMGGSWVDELPSVLWALRTTPKEGTGFTPFHLVYGGEAVVLVEVGIESDRVLHYNEENGERRRLELDMVDET
ncbi:uncharacterized protein LOC121990755 [Zingiber officinale]|uniref:uncharacterized protein LOC121990755 n=1 Tax=Zingiber officinale TaxID=94328 RepID=UPI001C4D09D0|nr:uncharacterized protein LOC121990755 [Zingiber officinale]